MTTTLVLAWLLERLIRAEAKPEGQARWAQLFPGAAILGVAALALPWLLWRGASPLPPDYPLRPGTLTDGLWPILLGLALFALVRRLPLPDLPPGDLLALQRPLSPSRIGRLPAMSNWRPRVLRPGLRLLRQGRRVEAMLLHWPVGGTLLFTAVLVLVLAVLLS